jgi:hypothetical protein
MDYQIEATFTEVSRRVALTGRARDLSDQHSAAEFQASSLLGTYRYEGGAWTLAYVRVDGPRILLKPSEDGTRRLGRVHGFREWSGRELNDLPPFVRGVVTSMAPRGHLVFGDQ